MEDAEDEKEAVVNHSWSASPLTGFIGFWCKCDGYVRPSHEDERLLNRNPVSCSLACGPTSHRSKGLWGMLRLANLPRIPGRDWMNMLSNFMPEVIIISIVSYQRSKAGETGRNPLMTILLGGTPLPMRLNVSDDVAPDHRNPCSAPLGIIG